MDIKEFYFTDNKAHWIEQMKKCDWGVWGVFLCELCYY